MSAWARDRSMTLTLPRLRSFWALPLMLCALLSTAALYAKEEGTASGAFPNILIVYVDDLGYGDTATYGHPVVETPHINRLAEEGLKFTQFYAPSALCSPSRAGLLTGRTPYRTGVRDWIPPESAVTLGANEFTIADLAKARGYRTAVIGKWHLNGGLAMADAPQPRDFGFDYQYGLDAWVKSVGVAAGEAPRHGHMYPSNMYRNHEAVGATDRFSAELVADEALHWLGKNDEPFFLYLTFSEVHTPIASPREYVERYDAYLTDESRTNPDLYYFDFLSRPSRGTGEYFANITFMDAQLGRVLEHLRERGRLDETLVVFSSDNGPVTAQAETPWEIGMAGDTGGLRGKKRYLFEGGIRVPGIVRYPALVEAGAVSHAPATALDLLPTLSELIDVPLESAIPLDGQSLMPLLRGEPLERDRAFYWSIETPDGLEFAVRDGDWKLLLDGDGEPAYLFDLATDRYEVVDKLSSEPEIADRLIAEFRSLREEVLADSLARAREENESGR